MSLITQKQYKGLYHPVYMSNNIKWTSERPLEHWLLVPPVVAESSNVVPINKYHHVNDVTRMDLYVSSFLLAWARLSFLYLR